MRLARAFGKGDDRHLFFFEQYWPDSDAGMTVSGPAFKRFHRRRDVKIAFIADQEEAETKPFTGNVEGVGPALIWNEVSLKHPSAAEKEPQQSEQLPQISEQFAANANSLTIRQGGRSVVLKTGPMKGALDALNQCSQGLLKEWGLDPEKHLTATQKPKWQNQHSITRRIQDNYPSAALLRREQGIMRMRAIIDETGAVSECVIVNATTAERLESPACKSMKEAKFTPALDAQGKPFKSYYATSVTYQIGR